MTWIMNKMWFKIHCTLIANDEIWLLLILWWQFALSFTSPTLRNLENTVISRFEIDFKDMYIVCCPGVVQLGGLVLGSLLHTLAHTKDYWYKISDRRLNPLFVQTQVTFPNSSNSAKIKANTWKLRLLESCLSQVLPIYLLPIQTRVIGQSVRFFPIVESDSSYYPKLGSEQIVHKYCAKEKNSCTQIKLYFGSHLKNAEVE